MTKNELEQIYYLNRELKMWERELAELKAQSLVHSPQLSAVHSRNISDNVGDRAQKKADLEAFIKAKKDELQDARDKALRYIADIPDSLTRMVVYYHCVSLMSWRRVAYEVGGANTEESVRKIYTRFFEREM